MQGSQHLSASTLTRVATLVLLGGAGSVYATDIRTQLKPSMEVPAVSSAASGMFRGTIDDATGSISYELSYSGLEGDVRQAHIHLGQRGVNGGIMVWLCQTTFNTDPTGLAPTCPQSGTVTGVLQAANVLGPSGQGIDAMEFAEVTAALRAGLGYANVHSTKFPGGEVRGQVRAMGSTLDDD